VNKPALQGRRVAGLVTLVLAGATIASMAAAPTSAAPAAVTTCTGNAPVLQLANPSPGDVLSQGDYIVSGLAFDPSAGDGTGIARVDLFLGERDDGGLFLAEATPGAGLTDRDFSTKVTFPTSANGGRNFVAYAYSSVTGEQTSESVPVYVGAPPTATPITSNAPTPVPLTSTIQSNCTLSSAAPVSASIPAPGLAQQAAVLGVRSGPVLSLGNPSPGDNLQTGDVMIHGVAYDPAANGAGSIDSVTLFLDNRDEGGLPLGSVVPSGDNTFNIEVKLPSAANGGHNFVVYARSALTGQEAVASVPIYIGLPPTATPRPKP
jgi:hypothetical protein